MRISCATCRSGCARARSSTANSSPKAWTARPAHSWGFCRAPISASCWCASGLTGCELADLERCGLLARSRADQRIQIDIGLARRPDVKNLKTVGLEPILDQPDLLDADHFLPRIRNDEAGGRRPDVADVGIVKIPALVNMAAGDQPQIDGAKHLDQVAACRHRNVADRGRR